MRTGTSLVVLDVPFRRVGRKRSALLFLVAPAGALTGLAGLGIFMVLSGIAERGQPLALAALGREAPSGTPEIAIAPIVFAQPWTETHFPIHVAPVGPQRGSSIRIDGLPALAMLSEGHATRPGSWTIPVSRLASLRITSPATEDATPRLAIALVSPDGVVLSEVRPLLAVVRPERIGPRAVLLPSPQQQAPPQHHAQPQPQPMQPTQCSARATPPRAVEPAAWAGPGAKAEARALVRKADEALSKGRVAAARQTYEYAADEMRWPTGALALAATYDPHELGYLAPLVVADAAKARHWYERARTLTDSRIDYYVQRLALPAAAGPAAAITAQSADSAPVWVWFGAIEAKTIVRWGDEALSGGYIEAARQIYEYGAAVMLWPTAAQSLAATYDPDELKHLQFRSFAPEPEKARLWYERSRQLMSARIDFHLQRLGAAPAPGPPRAQVVASCW
jgi:hypothetical protein